MKIGGFRLIFVFVFFCGFIFGSNEALAFGAPLPHESGSTDCAKRVFIRNFSYAEHGRNFTINEAIFSVIKTPVAGEIKSMAPPNPYSHLICNGLSRRFEATLCPFVVLHKRKVATKLCNGGWCSSNIVNRYQDFRRPPIRGEVYIAINEADPKPGAVSGEKLLMRGRGGFPSLGEHLFRMFGGNPRIADGKRQQYQGGGADPNLYPGRVFHVLGRTSHGLLGGEITAGNIISLALSVGLYGLGFFLGVWGWDRSTAPEISIRPRLGSMLVFGFGAGLCYLSIRLFLFGLVGLPVLS